MDKVLETANKLVEQFTDSLYKEITRIDSLTHQGGNRMLFDESRDVEHTSSCEMSKVVRDYIFNLKLSYSLREEIFKTACGQGLIAALKSHEVAISNDPLNHP